MKGRQHICGFTLIELLVVISIIALLITLLLPALGSARRNAQFNACATTLRSIGQAHAAYGLDQKDNRPPLYRPAPRRLDWVSPDTKWSGEPIGQGLLVEGGYLSTFDSLLCPSNAMQQDAQRDRENWENVLDAGSSYAYFWRHPDSVRQPILDNILKGATYTRAQDLGRPALSMDLNAEEGHTYSGDFAGRPWVSHPGIDAINIVFLDASVERADLEACRLRFPGGPFDELDWFDLAHEMRR